MPDISNIIEASKAAAAILLDKWPASNQSRLVIEEKADGTAVTEADFASNEIIISALNKYFPEDGIISEEIPRTKSESKKDTVWIIDPLDGTQSFIDGKDDFSILIARVEAQQVTHSILNFPALKVLATAERGKGAFINGEPIRVSLADKLEQHSVYIRNFECNQPQRYPQHMDSGRAFLAVARGEISAAVMKMGRHQEWDLAAPSLLIEEAGGLISDENGAKIQFNQEQISYQYFCASNGKVATFLKELIPGKNC